MIKSVSSSLSPTCLVFTFAMHNQHLKLINFASLRLVKNGSVQEITLMLNFQGNFLISLSSHFAQNTTAQLASPVVFSYFLDFEQRSICLIPSSCVEILELHSLFAVLLIFVDINIGTGGIFIFLHCEVSGQAAQPIPLA